MTYVFIYVYQGMYLGQLHYIVTYGYGICGLRGGTADKYSPLL